LRANETQLEQLLLGNLLSMLLHLLDIPVHTNKAATQEVRIGPHKVQRHRSRQILLILRHRREGVDDHAATGIGFHDTWVDGKGSQVRLLKVEALGELDGGELGGAVRGHAGDEEGGAEADEIDKGSGVGGGGDEVVGEVVGAPYVGLLSTLSASFSCTIPETKM
jgi:hypothetical protein